MKHECQEGASTVGEACGVLAIASAVGAFEVPWLLGGVWFGRSELCSLVGRRCARLPAKKGASSPLQTQS
eukprot:7123715-Prymnesium_polylepis.2